MRSLLWALVVVAVYGCAGGAEAPTGAPATSPQERRTLTATTTPADPLPPAQPRNDSATSAELVAVEVTPQDGLALIRFTLAAPVHSPERESVVWAVEIVAENDLIVTVSAQRLGARLVAALYDWRSGEQSPLEPRVDGHILELAVDPAPWGAAFRWHALTQRDGADGDRVPADGTVEGYGKAA